MTCPLPTPHSLPWCGLRDLLNDPYGRPALNLGYLLDGVMGASSRRLEFERFSRRESRQQLKIVASGLNSRKSRVLSRGAGHWDDRKSLIECIRASMLLPGETSLTTPLSRPHSHHPTLTTPLSRPHCPHRSHSHSACISQGVFSPNLLPVSLSFPSRFPLDSLPIPSQYPPKYPPNTLPIPSQYPPNTLPISTTRTLWTARTHPRCGRAPRGRTDVRASAVPLRARRWVHPRPRPPHSPRWTQLRACRLDGGEGHLPPVVYT